MTSDTAAVLPTQLLVAATVLAAASGLPTWATRLRPATAQRMAAIIMLTAAAVGLTAAGLTLADGRSALFTIDWPFPFGPPSFGLDPLSALLTVPILLVAACCSIYVLDYRPATTDPQTFRKTTRFFGLLVAALLGVVMARCAGLFLLAWEIMALSAYFVLTTDDHLPAVRDAGMTYLICTHIGTLALFALFAILKTLSGSFIFPAPGSLAATAPLATACYLLLIFGFGFKAGLMPLHVWLPAAHANAPSHISAIMSGVILKIGIYGIIRTLSFFTAIPLWWGGLLLTLGMASGILGVVFALGQHDIKRLLAYHSIENIGIIVMGIGVAVIGMATGSTTLTLLGMAGALLHLINHGLFKSLLFLGAGAVIHGTGTREMDRMGGLAKRMPVTAALFLVASLAICGLPPLNGFVSEWLLYLGFFNGVVHHNGGAAIVNALAAPALALIGGLAVACFVKVVGVVFLGEPRTPEARQGHEPGWLMRLPMGGLALLCLVIGLAPISVAPLLDTAVAACLPHGDALPHLTELASFGWLTVSAMLVLATTLLGWGWSRLRQRGNQTVSVSTWGCGYQAPTARIQYTASSFADMLVAFFAGVLRPQAHRPRLHSFFPKRADFASHVPETVLENLYLPFLTWANGKFSTLRRLQHGHLHLYILYTFLTLVVLIAISLS